MNIDTHTLVKILVGVVVVLAVGEIYTLTKLNSGIQPLAPEASQQKAAALPPSNILRPVSGIVQSADASRIVLSGGSSTTTIFIDSSTSVVTQGALKDSAQQEADIETFRQSSAALAADPVKNKLALETLIAPAPFKEIPVQPASIALGSRVIAYVFVKDGALHAVKVVVLSAAAR